jgi:hypothetical protein
MSQKFNGNCFMVTRSETEGVSVVKLKSHEIEKKSRALVERSFHGFFMNLEGRLPEIVHQDCLATILPTMALLLFHERPQDSEELKDAFLANADKNLVEAAQEYPDQESLLYFALEFKLNTFLAEIELKGFEKAIANNEKFYTAIHSIYFELPLIFIKTIIDMASA